MDSIFRTYLRRPFRGHPISQGPSILQLVHGRLSDVAHLPHLPVNHVTQSNLYTFDCSSGILLGSGCDGLKRESEDPKPSTVNENHAPGARQSQDTCGRVVLHLKLSPKCRAGDGFSCPVDVWTAFFHLVLGIAQVNGGRLPRVVLDFGPCYFQGTHNVNLTREYLTAFTQVCRLAEGERRIWEKCVVRNHSQPDSNQSNRKSCCGL